MKFKVQKDTPLYDKLWAMRERIKEVEKVATDLVEELGYKQYATSNQWVAGGIAGIKCDSKPDGWKAVGESWQKLYLPKISRANKALNERIQNLPKVTCEEVNSIIGFNIQTVSRDGQLLFITSYGWCVGGNFALINIGEGVEFTPVEGMEEVKVSEYQQMIGEINAEK